MLPGSLLIDLESLSLHFDIAGDDDEQARGTRIVPEQELPRCLSCIRPSGRVLLRLLFSRAMCDRKSPTASSTDN